MVVKSNEITTSSKFLSLQVKFRTIECRKLDEKKNVNEIKNKKKKTHNKFTVAADMSIFIHELHLN